MRSQIRNGRLYGGRMSWRDRMKMNMVLFFVETYNVPEANVSKLLPPVSSWAVTTAIAVSNGKPMAPPWVGACEPADLLDFVLQRLF